MKNRVDNNKYFFFKITTPLLSCKIRKIRRKIQKIYNLLCIPILDFLAGNIKEREFQKKKILSFSTLFYTYPGSDDVYNVVRLALLSNQD